MERDNIMDGRMLSPNTKNLTRVDVGRLVSESRKKMAENIREMLANGEIRMHLTIGELLTLLEEKQEEKS